MEKYYKTVLLFSATLFVLTGHVFSLNMTEMPGNIQTKNTEPQERTISLRLPLLQPDFHWTFMSREDFLSGKLLLRIIRNDKTEEIIIFDNGSFSNGWSEMSVQIMPGRGEIYFGFVSTARYLTAPGDKLELELTVNKDLPGIGAMLSGNLKAGKYKSSGTYSGLIDEYDTSALEEKLVPNGEITDEQQQLLEQLHSVYDYKAFMENWQQQWSLDITSQKGWLSEEQAASVKTMLKRIQTGNSETAIDGVPQVTGIVRDNKGEPVPDAAVIIQPPFVKDTKTDIEGRFSIRVRVDDSPDDGESYLLVRHRQRNLVAAVKLEDETENLDVSLSPGITLSGKVLSPDRNGIQNAKIELIIWTSELGYSKSEPVEIDKQGNFQINALPPGFRYSVFAQADGFGRDYADIQTSQTSGDNYELDPLVLNIANLSVSGVVVDRDGKPLAKVGVSCYGEGQPSLSVTTDQEGKFRLEKVCEGKIRISALKSSGRTIQHNQVETEGGATDVKIILSENLKNSDGRKMRSLLVQHLPEMKNIFSDFPSDKVQGRAMLICFWDYEQRPSRNCMLQLAKQAQLLEEKDIVVVTIQASKIERKILDGWIEENGISFPVGMIEGDEEKIRSTWGIRSLPRLILTDKQHTITAEGFGIAELDEKLDKK